MLEAQGVKLIKPAANFDEGAIFEERAERLSAKQLDRWTQITPREASIISKLTDRGQKLLSGPRGSGKSTLLRQAFFKTAQEKRHIAVYVNYSRSLALEPLFKDSTNALVLFRQWVLSKIVVGVSDSLNELEHEGHFGSGRPESLIQASEKCSSYIRSLEQGRNIEPTFPLAPTELVTLLEGWTGELQRKRCVLLLDDAAHAFSPEQQREFFEIFRELKSLNVSAKAAVYPGITSYSPNFHLGHDAELVESWFDPADEDYLQIMRGILKKRLPDSLLGVFSDKQELIDYLALASFGIPRGLIAMVSNVLGVIDDESPAKVPTRPKALEAVAEHVHNVQLVFDSLSEKIVRYRRFIEVGRELTDSSIAEISRYNNNKEIDNKATQIAFMNPAGGELERVFQFLEYAGIVRGGERISRGDKSFTRYTFHYAFIADKNALSIGRTFAITDVVSALSNSSKASYPRVKASTLLGDDFRDRCTIDLAPCGECGNPRAAEDARFCVHCGSKLGRESVYEELLKASINKLPLTPNKIDGIIKHTDIRTINDVLVDEDNRKLRSVPSIGPVWCSKIKTYAEEYVSV